MHLAKKKVLLFGVCVLLIISVILAIIIILIIQREGCDIKFNSLSELGRYRQAAVSTNGRECAQIGSDILKKNGSAVDAAIATLLCEGVASLHSMGLGGGFLMTIWDAKNGRADYLDARETAPAAAKENMFHGDAHLSMYGGLAVAVPGELRGYWEAHKKYGKLKWRELFEPTIALCLRGSVINDYLYAYLINKESKIKAESTLADILINPATKRPWKVGEKIKRPKLAKTLRLIANNGPDIFYNGSMTDEMVTEIQSFKGIITREDFETYSVKWKKPIEINVDDLTIYTAPPPGSGVILAFIINILQNIVSINNQNIMWHRIVEAFKWAYAKRTELGDPEFVDIERLLTNLTSKDYAKIIKNEINDYETSNDPKHYGAVTATTMDSGTAHVSVLAPDGSAVSVTSTINQVFGAMIRSKSTGIIFNDEMDDFSSPDITNGFEVPPSPANFIRPGKRPLSSMSPTIVIGKDKVVRLVIGAAGGTKITTAIATCMILNLWGGYNIKETIDSYRIHHQLLPMTAQTEKGFCPDIIQYLREVKHNVSTFTGIGSAITAVANDENGITANSDYRRQGSVAGF
ncbi:glutathione hydrolase 1 proenzyme-like isoform X2 [Vespa mandarinia]|uniref:glutathione hydrolase 1 proenzyme-like isoform X2 n=1 Tax=Vespa mandarinia TaxID=7446 RepID=UPI00161375D9|nr:glutathione hydrolase 1 proenzyme-like isoform X2 [Vespa mandarinia]